MNQTRTSNRENHHIIVQREKLPPNVPVALREIGQNIGLIDRGSGLNVGMVRSGDGRITVLPFTYELPLTNVDRVQAAQLLYGVLSRYARERQLIDELSSPSLPAIGSAAWLIKEQAAVSLWQDFQERGPLSTWSNVLSSDPTGKPNWSRSLGSNQWIKSSRKNQFLPANVIYTSRAKHRDDLFSSIYLWLASLGAQIACAALSVKRVKPIVSPIEASVIVKREQRRAYRRRDRRVIDLMLEALDGGTWPTDRNGVTDPAHYVVTDFDRVWEDVLRQTLDGIKLTISLPAGQWEGQNVYKGIVPLPDILRLHGPKKKQLVIIDAKYYTGKEGSAGDHYKQIIYAKLARQLGYSVEANILLFAATGNDDQKVFSFLRRHSWQEMSDSVVHEITCAYATAARAYAERVSGLNLDDLVLTANGSLGSTVKQ